MALVKRPLTPRHDLQKARALAIAKARLKIQQKLDVIDGPSDRRWILIDELDWFDRLDNFGRPISCAWPQNHCWP